METQNEQASYILLNDSLSLSYDKSKCFVNGNESKKEGSTKSSAEECLERQRLFYDSYLKRHWKNVVILCGAGTSIENGGKKSNGKTRVELWADCKAEIDAICNKIKDLDTKELDKKDFYDKKDIEGFLSHILLYEKFIDEPNRAVIVKLRKALESKIAKACKLKLDKSAPHTTFLNKITARKASDPRVKIFTTNYDSLFEQASNKGGFIVIDGFSFSHPRRFAGGFFDIDVVNRDKTRIKQEESFVSKVFQLYKLHGSLNWVKEADGSIAQKEETNEPLIIYPANDKYESSYEQPYFEMMARFQQALRKENTLLIVVGFGFQDKHIKNAIVEAVDQNASFQLLIVNYNANESINPIGLEEFFVDVTKMRVKSNVTITFDSFANFATKYPSNSTYMEPEKGETNEPIQS